VYILRMSFRYRRSQSHLSIIPHPGQMSCVQLAS
jgi:hypothetical protein